MKWSQRSTGWRKLLFCAQPKVYTFFQLRLCVHVRAYVCAYMYPCVHVCVHGRAYVCAYMYPCVHACLSLCVFSIYGCIGMCMHVCIWFWHVFMCDIFSSVAPYWSCPSWGLPSEGSLGDMWGSLNKITEMRPPRADQGVISSQRVGRKSM